MPIKNLFRYWTFQVFSPGTVLREKYESFKTLLEHDKAAHDHMAALEEIYYSQKKCDFQAIVKIYDQFSTAVVQMVDALLKMCPSNYWDLKAYFKKFDFYVRFMLAPPEFDFSPPFTIEFDQIALFNETVAGKKAFSLSLLRKELCLPAPDGFVITTNAFYFFLEANGLGESINDHLAGLDINDAFSLKDVSCKIKEMILSAFIPEAIQTAVKNAVNRLEKSNKSPLRVALRSSAAKEDGNASFAGQYQTLLNITPQHILEGYKQVIASKYSPQALFYRISRGIMDTEAPMAVLVLEMIDSKSAGVMYTKDIQDMTSRDLLIHSIWGQGGLLVEGEVSPDVIRISKKHPDTIAGIQPASQKKEMILDPDGQTRVTGDRFKGKDRLSLDKPSALTLAKWGMSLEKHFKEPQDIEWCQDRSGRLFILQSRPMNIRTEKDSDTKSQMLGSGVPVKNNIICSKAETVCSGIGSGFVYRLEELSQIDQIPTGSVLVVRHALPQFVTAINKTNAVIIAAGSRASHFSSIAREFGIPAIVNLKDGFQDLIQGKQVTVDAARGIVYEGKADGLVKDTTPKTDFFTHSSFMVKLQYVMNFCTPLKLTDPGSETFAPESCRSLHDIIRFTHETALKEMFSIGDRKGGRKKGAKKLLSDIPMLFYVLDVGAGTKPTRNTSLATQDIVSTPMKAILKGLSHPGICWAETTHFDWEEYDRIVMAGGIISADSPQFGSYAVLSKEYLNVNFRFGYHFVIIDTICGSSRKDNYILFRFSGGGGTPEGRSLRAAFIKRILTRLGFMVDIKSDLIDAEFKHGSLETMKKTLDMTGRLLGATKLMDMYLKEGTGIEILINDFMNGRYDFRSAVDDQP